MLKVGIVGTGYVGLVTGTCLAEIGHAVVCVDADKQKIARLCRGQVPIYEPGLDAYIARNVAAGRLSFASDIGEVIGSDELVLFVAVGTPTRPDGSANLEALFEAVEQAAIRRSQARRAGPMVLVIKSTVPVGTCRAVQSLVERYLPAKDFAIVSNPEFLREGSAITDFMQPDRIVVGSASEAALAVMRQLYAPLSGENSVLLEVSSLESSEMIKYASNVFLATKIALINEFSGLCEAVGADITELATGIGLDRRIGAHFLKTGPGFGGSCFPKDLYALTELAVERGRRMPIAEAVIDSNERRKRSMADRVSAALDDDLRDARIAVLGLSFKAGTDDIRESPAIALILALLDSGARICAYDPAAAAATARVIPDIDYARSAEEAVVDADAVVIATEWPQFAALDWASLSEKLRRPLIVDLRNLLSPAKLTGLGYDYVGLGRAPSIRNAVPVNGRLLRSLSANGPGVERPSPGASA